MINAIRGTLCHKGADTIRVDNNGIEWEFSVPARSVDAFGRLGDEARVLCWLLHREDQMRLYGFKDEAERAVFMELLGVDGIGPKQALKILGGIGASELEAALEAEDLSRLSAVPGLGKKTAQKLVFSLKGRLPASLGSTSPVPSGPHEDIARALVDMGYDRKSVAEALARAEAALSGNGSGGTAVSPHGDGAAEPAELERELFRRAIVELSVR